MTSPPGPETVIDGRRYLYFAGTGYLGLQGHPEVVRAACEAAERFGIGTATSRTALGNSPPVLEVERRAAGFFGLDDAFCVASGYAGNHILTLALEGTFDALFVDELSHYCVFEAARLSGKPVFPVRHCDAEDLRAKLKANLKPTHYPLLMTDGVFAARGSIAPLAEYQAALAEFDGAALCVDDAHGIGVLGEHGRGTYEHAGLFDAGVNDEAAVGDASHSSGPRPFLCGTLSKAIGGYGGIIPGSKQFIERLKITSPYYAGASPPPAPVAAASAKALELVAAQPDIRRRLGENVTVLKGGLRQLGLGVDDTPVPIVSLSLGDADNMRRIQRELESQGICIAYFAAYAGLGPQGALRIAVFATHTETMIQRLLDELGKLL